MLSSAVAAGRADVAIDILPVLHQQIEGFPRGKVKLVGVTDVQFPLQIMVGRDHARFVHLLNRAIDAITPEERAANHNKWLLRDVVTAPDYRLLWQVLATALLILAIILVWNHRLHREVGRRKRAEAELLHAKEKAESANRAKGRFLANKSHEIRTPLNGVIGLACLSLETDPAPALRRYLGKIDLSARTLLALINDILDLTRIEAGKLESRREPLELAEVLDRVRAMTEQAAADKGLDLRTEGPAAPVGPLFGDGLHLTQVLLNLAGNAIKFTPTGSVTLRVRMEAEDDPVNQLLARDLLSRRGAEVTVATTGTEAVAAVADTKGREPFHILLMEFRRPEMDGLEACRRIRALPGGARLPILALTANALAEERERCLAAGMDGYLTKPLAPRPSVPSCPVGWRGPLRGSPRRRPCPRPCPTCRGSTRPTYSGGWTRRRTPGSPWRVPLRPITRPPQTPSARPWTPTTGRSGAQPQRPAARRCGSGTPGCAMEAPAHPAPGAALNG